MTKIEREKQTVRRMIELYCRHHLKQDTMPEMIFYSPVEAIKHLLGK